MLQLRYGGVKAVELHPHWRMDLFMPEVEGYVITPDASAHQSLQHCNSKPLLGPNP